MAYCGSTLNLNGAVFRWRRFFSILRRIQRTQLQCAAFINSPPASPVVLSQLPLSFRIQRFTTDFWSRPHLTAVIDLFRNATGDGKTKNRYAVFSQHQRNFSQTPNNRQHSSDSNNNNNQSNKNNNDDDSKQHVLRMLVSLAITYAIMTSLARVMSGSSRQDQSEWYRSVSWHEFEFGMLARGEVERVIVQPGSADVVVVLHPGAIVDGRPVEQNLVRMSVPDIEQFEQKLRLAEARIGVRVEDQVPVIYDRHTGNVTALLSTLVVAALLFYLTRGFSKMNLSLGSMGSMTRAKFTVVDPVSGGGRGVKFSDVAGLHEAKQEVVEFIDYLKRPDYYRNLGAKVPKGALLLGPPGCGKTLLAKAVATEGSVPFLSMNGSEFIEMLGGLGAARVRNLFKEARKRSPCIIYIDEIDAVGRARGGSFAGAGGGGEGASGEMEQTLNQLLVEMDGMSTVGGVVILASTNRADLLDKALLRPGRFDRLINIDLPTLLERQQIFNQHLSSIVLDQAPEHYSRWLAQLTPGFSGADIMNVCNEAALKAARFHHKHVASSDLEYAVERVVGGTEKRSHAMSPWERRMTAVHQSGHAVAGWMLEHADALLSVSVVPRTGGQLGAVRHATADRKLYTGEQLFDRMCMALGGRAAELIVFNTVTDSGRDDLARVTKMAYDQVRQYGMDSVLGPISFDERGGGRRPYSKQTAALIDNSARALVARAYQRTERLLRDNQDKLIVLSDMLMSRDSLKYEEVVQLIGEPPCGSDGQGQLKKQVSAEDFEDSLPDKPASDSSNDPASSSSSQASSLEEHSSEDDSSDRSH